MQDYIPYTIMHNGKIIDLSRPQVMGILNVTPDSFFDGSRKQTEKEIAQRIEQICQEGASIIDIGAYSSRANADVVSTKEEMARLQRGLKLLKDSTKNILLSVDTFRADVAKMCVEEYGVDIINDISGGTLDKEMFSTVARLKVPYILMHMKGDPQTMQLSPFYHNIVSEVCDYFEEKILLLNELGVQDIILDPGFGFAKTLEHNYQLLHHLEELHRFHLPILVGISRKSMIYNLLGITPADALNGTSVLNTISLMKGAHILRVHDVKECIETIQITQALINNHV